MLPILMHYALTLDLAGQNDTQGIVSQFIDQASLSGVKKSVEMVGDQCTIRFTIEGPATLAELRLAAKGIKGLFSEVTRAAVKPLKEQPSDIFLELKIRPPLFGRDEDGSYNS